MTLIQTVDMAEWANLLESISVTIQDYRAGEIDKPTPKHVERWMMQFNESVQLPILRELDHVLKNTYYSREKVQSFMEKLLTETDGSCDCDFWRKINFLRIQQQGQSQTELLSIFDSVLEAKCGFNTDVCGSVDGYFLYFDDALFSGSRIGNDLDLWIEQDAPTEATVTVIVIAGHTSGKWLAENRLKEKIISLQKKIEVECFADNWIENRKTYKRDTGVLWPSELPENEQLSAYLELPHKYPFEPRPVGGKLGPFSSEEGRKVLEHELTLAGIRIRGFCQNPKEIMRPLGFGYFGLGFGTMIVTFRNCPNNCPLALWWGDPDYSTNHSLGKWYPLFPRKTYT
ncbi:MAG: hypothetical protein WBP54_06585 [Pelodictyon phaeoclathratiforme]